MELLKIAKAMKQQAKLPSNLSLWAVENPLRSPASRLATKVPKFTSVNIMEPLTCQKLIRSRVVTYTTCFLKCFCKRATTLSS